MNPSTTENAVVAPPSPTVPALPHIGLNKKLVMRGSAVALAVLLAGLAVPYIVLGRFYIALLLQGLLLAMLALGIGFLARHLGLISLGHTAFFGGAAYSVAITTTHWGWDPLQAVLFGFLVGTAIALAMGALVVRASGIGFLMLTLALGQALYQLCIQEMARPITGAHDGLQVQYASTDFFLGMSASTVMTPGLFWPVAWVALVLAAFGLWMVGRSRFGTVLEGIRENEERMRFSGYGTFMPRLLAFVISGAVAALGGALFALNAGYVSPELLSFLKAGDSLISAIIGGLGTLLGPVVGAFLYVYAQAQFNTSGNLHLYTGAALVLVLMFLPGGITGGFAQLARRSFHKLKEKGGR